MEPRRRISLRRSQPLAPISTLRHQTHQMSSRSRSNPYDQNKMQHGTRRATQEHTRLDVGLSTQCGEMSPKPSPVAWMRRPTPPRRLTRELPKPMGIRRPVLRGGGGGLCTPGCRGRLSLSRSARSLLCLLLRTSVNVIFAHNVSPLNLRSSMQLPVVAIPSSAI